jgi:serine protease Do
MKKLLIIITSLGLLLTASITLAELPPNATQQHSLAPMLKKAMPAVVNIVNRGTIQLFNDPFLKRELMKHKEFRMLDNKHFVSFGSGVIIDAKKGLIVTNAHLVDFSRTITVTLSDGRHYHAKKIGADNETDIAVIQIQAPNLIALAMADSNNITIGDFVVAIGSPFGLKQSVTSGIVSALNRSNLGIEGYENFIQTDAPINIGNSGGALVNMQGELIGINTALISNSGGNVGIGFAIPSNMTKSIVDQLLKFGKVHRGLMGVLVQTLTPDVARAFKQTKTKGAIVSYVVPYSPAAIAGIKVGDIITKLNDKKIKSSDDIRNLTGLLRIGDTAKLTIIRNDKKINIAVRTSDPSSSKQKDLKNNPYFYGVQLLNVTEQNPAHGYTTGIRVLAVDEYSPAGTAGLRPGDVIVSANHIKVKSIKALQKAATPNESGLLLNILRENGAVFLVIK